MGCAASRDAVAAAVARASCCSSLRAPCCSSSCAMRKAARRAAAKLCRERAALARAAADRRSALAAAHAAYLRSLAAVGGALRRFAAASLAPGSLPPPARTLPPSPVAAAAVSSSPPPTSPSSTVSPLSHSLSSENHGGGGGRKSLSSTARHYARSSATVPATGYENPYAQPQYAEGEVIHGHVYGHSEAAAEETPGSARGQPPSPPMVTPWDFFDPFTHCDGFAEDYYACRRNLPPASSPDYAALRRTEGIPELEDDTESDASSKPSTSRAADDQNAKAKAPSPDNAAPTGDPSGGELQRTGSEPATTDNGEVGERSASRKNGSVPSNASASSKSLEGGTASSKGSEPALGANGKAGKPSASSNGAAPSNGSSASKQEGEKKSSPASSKGAVRGAAVDASSSSEMTMKKKKAAAFDEEEPARAAATGGNDGESHGEPAVQSAVSSEPSSPSHHGTRDVTAAMDEVYKLFTEAANSGAAVASVLGTGRAAPRRAKLRVLRYISSRVVDPLALTVSTSSCLPRKLHGRKSRSRGGTSASWGSTSRRDGFRSLSSTLDKLWVWEKKLYREMKDKEKLRKQYKKMYRRLKTLDERGVESSIVDATRLSVSLLQSKIGINIGTANVFSSTIQKIRDEELYPQLVALILRFRRLWKEVLECHEKQLSVIQDSDIYRLKAVTLSQSGAASLASEELERELMNWHHCFNDWIGSQQSFVEALYRWLKRWLPEVQEEVTPRRVPQPAPPAFVVSNKWLQATERVSVDEVLRSMDNFSKLVHELKKSQEDEQQQKQKADHASRDYRTKREVLKAAFGLRTGLDVVAVMANPYYSHDDRVRDVVKARRRRNQERTRHDEILSHAHVAATATLPFGLVPMLQQIISFFQGNLNAYMQITIQGT